MPDTSAANPQPRDSDTRGPVFDSDAAEAACVAGRPGHSGGLSFSSLVELGDSDTWDSVWASAATEVAVDSGSSVVRPVHPASDARTGDSDTWGPILAPDAAEAACVAGDAIVSAGWVRR